MVLQGKQSTHVPKLVAGDIGARGQAQGHRHRRHACAKARPVLLAWRPAPRAGDDLRGRARSPRATRRRSATRWQRLHRGRPDAARRPRPADQGVPALAAPASCTSRSPSPSSRSAITSRSSSTRPRCRTARPSASRPTATAATRSRPAAAASSPTARSRSSRSPRGDGFEFVDEIFGGAIPHNYQPGGRERHPGGAPPRLPRRLPGGRLQRPPARRQVPRRRLLGNGVQDRRLAGLQGRHGARPAPTILEPIMKVEVHTPEEFMGDVMGDLSHRRGRPQGMDAKTATQIIKALVPHVGDARTTPRLRAMTQGAVDLPHGVLPLRRGAAAGPGEARLPGQEAPRGRARVILAPLPHMEMKP